MTLRHALALSRNIVTVKVAEATGYDRVANLWKKVGVGTPALAVPSIALGVFEASPLEIASAYTIFTNGGAMLQAMVGARCPGRRLRYVDSQRWMRRIRGCSQRAIISGERILGQRGDTECFVLFSECLSLKRRKQCPADDGAAHRTPPAKRLVDVRGERRLLLQAHAGRVDLRI